jgi:hypothetical protein
MIYHFGIPPVLKATTGVPQLNASIIVLGRLSSNDGVTNNISHAINFGQFILRCDQVKLMYLKRQLRNIKVLVFPNITISIFSALRMISFQNIKRIYQVTYALAPVVYIGGAKQNYFG